MGNKFPAAGFSFTTFNQIIHKLKNTHHEKGSF